MQDKTTWLEIHDPEISSVELVDEIDRRVKQRREKLGPVRLVFPTFGTVSPFPEPPTDRTYNPNLYHHLRRANEMAPPLTTPVLAASPATQIPILGRHAGRSGPGSGAGAARLGATCARLAGPSPGRPGRSLFAGQRALVPGQSRCLARVPVGPFPAPEHVGWSRDGAGRQPGFQRVPALCGCPAAAATGQAQGPGPRPGQPPHRLPARRAGLCPGLARGRTGRPRGRAGRHPGHRPPGQRRRADAHPPVVCHALGRAAHRPASGRRPGRGPGRGCGLCRGTAPPGRALHRAGGGVAALRPRRPAGAPGADPVRQLWRFVDGPRRSGRPPPFAAAEDVLREVMAARRTLVVAAADLAHVGPAFGDPYGLDFVAKAQLQNADERLLQTVYAGDAAGFFEQLAEPRATGGTSAACRPST